MTTPDIVLQDCNSCAAAIYGRTPPNEAYAARVATLLFGTIAHESDGFRARRQYGFSYESDRGAWGLCQCEPGSVRDSLMRLKTDQKLAKRVAVWLSGGDERATLTWLTDRDVPTVLRMLTANDRLAVLFARLHYFRVAEPVPESLEEQAAYYKRYYNTTAGKATPEDFLNAVHRYGTEYVDGDSH